MQSDLVTWLLAHYGQEVMRPGLDRIRSALTPYFSHFKNTKIIIVAGTNGKGETTLRLSQKLSHHRHNVWTSPHIERITERFRNENGEIDHEELQGLIQESHEEIKTSGISLSFYEFLFFVFCKWSAKTNPEFLLLEVGLGGRLDAVNVFDADLVLLPSISRDHQEILGRRYDEILKEKLGTLRSKTTLIHFLETDYLVERAYEVSDLVGAKVIALKEWLALPGFEFSLRNSALATAAFNFLYDRPVTIDFIPKDFQFLEHRGEVRNGVHEWIFFGSHNVDGMRKLIQFLHSGTYTFSRPPYDSIIVAFSRRSLQDLKVMMKMLKKSQLGKVVVTSFDHPKALSLDEAKALASEEGLEFVQDIEAYVQGKNGHQRMLVTGSYYFLGDFKSRFCR